MGGTRSVELVANCQPAFYAMRPPTHLEGGGLGEQCPHPAARHGYNNPGHGSQRLGRGELEGRYAPLDPEAV